MNDPNQLYLIDNDPVYQFTLRKCLELCSENVSLEIFNNGLDAISELRNQRDVSNVPDLIFLDLKMPMLDGWGFLKEYGKFYESMTKKPALYFMTSSIDENDREKAMHYPEVNGFLEKPYNLAELQNTLAQVGVPTLSEQKNARQKI